MFVPMVTETELPTAETDARWICVDERGSVLLVDGEFPRGAEDPTGGGAVHLLGADGDGPVRASRATPEMEVPAGGQWLQLRQLYGAVPERDWALAGRAVQVLNWDRDHRFCGRCGTETEPHARDRSKLCPSCGLQSFPRLTPAIIVLVERDDGKALLAWGRQFPGRFFSALAGFVEPGESLEECVVREVKEEAGIEVADISYFGSQPWPFPHSLMIGFQAQHAGGDLVLQESEIVEADWFPHDELPPVPKGGMSIAGWLIEDWIARQRA